MSANISIFIPHYGCKNQCSFCNQRTITGQNQIPSGQAVTNTIEQGIQSLNSDFKHTEIAFFGGSFTAIPEEDMLSYLEAAFPYVREKKVRGIRVSTRPDAIDEHRLNLLRQYGVTSIELGAQSMDNHVLTCNQRGHSTADIVSAAEQIKSFGFELGLQMMTGLYGSTEHSDRQTAEAIATLAPDTVRIYPTLVLKHTYLHELYQNHQYHPQTLEQAVALCADLLDYFENQKIRVIRTGLHTVDEEQLVCGPWHPALGELCKSRRFRNQMEKTIKKNSEVICHPTDRSQIAGQKKSNIQYFSNKGITITITEDSSIPKGIFHIKEVNGI